MNILHQHGNDVTFAPRSKPRLNRVGGMNLQNAVRTYRASPEDVLLQIRLASQYVSVALTFDEARELAARLIACCPPDDEDRSSLPQEVVADGGGTMTEDQIERRVEKMIDHLDACYLRGSMTKKNYDAAIKELHQWAEGQRFARKRPAEIDDGMGGIYRPGVVLSVDE